LDMARVHLDQALRYNRRFNVLDPTLASVQALLDSQGGLPAHTALIHLQPFADDLGARAGALAPLCVAMALFTINGRLTNKETSRLNRFARQCDRAGLDWLALECAHLLCRADTATPARRSTINTLGRATGLHPLSAAIEIEEPWRKSLRALEMAVAGADRHDGAADQARSRVVYLLHLSGSGQLTSISPLEQKLGAGGSWSKGRAIALQRLVSGERLIGLDEADQGLRAAVRQVDYGYGNPNYEFNLRLALPALVGHPRLFLADAPTTPVQVGRGEAEIQAVVKDGDLVIRLLPEPTADERYVLVRETPSRFRVVEYTDTHHRLARILGDKGLVLPEAAKGEAARVLTTLASLVPVHSSLPGTTHAVTTVPADPRPRVHLLPHGAGFRLEILVRPLDTGGPYLRPGEGAVSLMADVEGSRCLAERDLEEERRRAGALERSLPVLATLPELDGQWYAATPEEALPVLVELREAVARGEALVEWPEGEKFKLSRPVSAADLNLRLGSGDRWFTVEGELRVDDERVLDMRQLLELVQATPHRFLPLGEGQFVALTRELRRHLEELAAYVERRGRKLTLHPLAALALDDLTGQVGRLDAAPGWHDRLAEMRAALARTETPPSTLKARLRDYQLQGFQWLARLAHLGFGACLADDMGLGKTVQALAVILHCADQGPTLVVAPTPVCANWLTEARRFAPTLRLVPFGGADRQAQLADLGPFDLVVTSYGLLHQEAALLTGVAWQTVVLDEAQAIKNSTTRRSQAAMHLQAQFRLITTGTPIENHLGEFFTLFHFINPGLLGSRERFNERFAAPIERLNDREAGRRLKKLIQPFILRRLKSQVLEELPPRTEVLLEVELSPEETAFYEALRRQALERIETEAGAGGHQRMRILAEITRLRQACCHPRLVLPESTLPGAKLALFAEVVGELLDNGHKALVFSQFVGHLALIRTYLDEHAIPY
ncbi:MAG: DEAD/DEAH box helicase, partial [Desulfobulbus sp.]|nr:DEAD/DEAH box helicase [Desulfobulbus sp.]